MTLLAHHPERVVIREQLKSNVVLQALSDNDRRELEDLLVIVDVARGDFLLHQGVHEMEQYFVLDGLLKRVVSNADAKEMILRFADAGDFETSYAAWRLNTPTPYAIACVNKGRVAKLPMPQWVNFLEDRPKLKADFEYLVMRLMSDVLSHTITLHLLDASGRVHRFMRKHPDLADRIPKKELATYLNIAAETLSRLKQRGKI